MFAPWTRSGISPYLCQSSSASASRKYFQRADGSFVIASAFGCTGRRYSGLDC